ncbi:hypothetical protein [Paramuribaculum intestinale]|uniref:hypothetical protein n=1 Tax=Paramuribaculum intestinale TaxID=2094151 RepID=UPI0025AA0921|nr:hypothetical protein [Paramuribaculum intestinale]
MNQNIDEEWRELAARRERLCKESAQRVAEWHDYLDQNLKETLELLRRRHAYYTKLITDAGIKTVEEFYDRYKEHFLMYGIELKLSDNKKWCSIYLELGNDDFEYFCVVNDDTMAAVCDVVTFKDIFRHIEVDIFTGEEFE